MAEGRNVQELESQLEDILLEEQFIILDILDHLRNI
jgi:hypothetical protein